MLPALFWLGNRVTRLLPSRLRYPLAALIGRSIFYLMPRRRRIAYENYGQVLGLAWDHPRTKRVARHAFGNFAKMIVDFLMMSSLSPDAIRQLVRADGVEHLDQALAGGRGAIVVTAHVSNWDILAAAAAVRGYAVHAVTNTLGSDRLNDLVIASRTRIGMRTISTASGSLRRILTALAHNEIVALVCDLYRGDHGVTVNFFNRPTTLPAGPAALALKTGAPLVPVWVRRERDNHYVAEVEAPLEVSRTGDQLYDVQVTTERIVQFFERIIRRAPDQWFVFLPVWRPAVPTGPGSPLHPALEVP